MTEAMTQNNSALTINNPQRIEEEVRAMKDALMPNASDADLAIFAKYCAKTQLDPFSRQIYAINRGGRWGYQTSIDGFRVVAERSGFYEGQTPVYWCGKCGNWVEVWLDKNPPTAAKVGVYRKGHREPIWAVAKFESYVPINNQFWRKMPDLMIAKCAEALALRKAFPNDLSGIYTSEEMDQVDNQTPSQALQDAESTALVSKDIPKPTPTISDAQIKRFWVLANEAKVSAAEIDSVLEKWNLDSLKFLDRQRYDALCARFEKRIKEFLEEELKEVPKNDYKIEKYSTSDIPWG